MSVQTVLIDTEAEFAFVVRGSHHDTSGPSVTLYHKSDQRHKQRAELLYLAAGFLAWLHEHGVAIEQMSEDGGILVRDIRG